MLDLSKYVLVKAQKDIDAQYVLRLRHELNKYVDVTTYHILLDLSQASYIDSSGIAMILSLARYLLQAGGLLVIVNVSKDIYLTFERAGITTFLPVTIKEEATQLPAPTDTANVSQFLHYTFNKDTLADARSSLQKSLLAEKMSKIDVANTLLAVGEALGNVILHTPQQAGTLVAFRFSDRVVIHVQDSGPGFDIASVDNITPSLEHGRGIKMMRLLVDEVRFDITDSGTTVRLTKLLAGPTSQAPER